MEGKMSSAELYSLVFLFILERKVKLVFDLE